MVISKDYTANNPYITLMYAILFSVFAAGLSVLTVQISVWTLVLATAVVFVAAVCHWWAFIKWLKQRKRESK